MALTLRDALRIRIDRLQLHRARLLAEATALQIKIADLQAERDGLTQQDEERFARLIAYNVLRAEDSTP